MIEVHVWFNAGTVTARRITIPMNPGDTVGALRQTIIQPGLTPLTTVTTILNHATGAAATDAQALNDDDEFAAS